MHSLTKDQQCFLVCLFPPPPTISKATQIQQYEGVSKLVLRLAIAEYHMSEPKYEYKYSYKEILH